MDSLAVFFVASLVLSLAPGPDNLFVLTLSLQHGRQTGLWVVAGLCSGLLVHTAIVALGIAALLVTFPFALNLIKTLGALYLLYLAWKYWMPEAISEPATARLHSARELYLRGLVMNVSNPKVAVFFLAYLPQFVGTTQQPSLTIVFLGLIFILAALLVFGGIAVMAGSFSARFGAASGRKQVLSRVTSLVLVFLALNLFADWL